MKVVYIISIIVCLATAGIVSAQSYSISFDGDNDYIEIPDADILSPVSYTLELWVNQPALGIGSRNTYIYKNNGFGNHEWNFMEGQPNFGIGLYSYVGDKIFYSDFRPVPNVWTHIAVCFDTDINFIEMFVNGISVGQDTILTNVINTPGNLYFGRLPSHSNNNALTGIIDEVRISDVVRYTSNFTPPSSEFDTDSNTIALYHFNEGSGTSVTDASGNGNHGTIYNATWSTDVPLSGAVPVELTSFTAEMVKNSVKLFWVTASETNNFGFEIEKSFDSEVFSKIGFVEGKGTTTTPQQYIFEDDKIRNGTLYYRLKQIDTDGSFDYSDVILAQISFPENFSLGQNYPNPFNPATEISFQLPHSDKVTLKVYNLLGQEIRTLADGQFTAGIHTVRWDGKDNSGSMVSSGVFIYRIHTDSFSQIKKMLFVK